MSCSKLSGKRRMYDPKLVDEAATTVKSGSMSLCQAAKVYNIPKTTLYDRVKNRWQGTKLGPKTVLTAEEEDRIAKWAIHMARIGFGKTRQELAHVVKRILDDEQRVTPFTDNKPGRSWMKGFFKRHPSLNIRTTVQLGKERAIISKEKINRWFQNLKDYVTNEVGDTDMLNDPSRIYNADETGVSLCQTKNCKVIGETGSPVVYQYGNSDKTQMTIMAAASAIGHYIDPMIIFPGQRFSYNPLEGFEDAALGRSDNGWMDSQVFAKWLSDVFIPGIESRHVKKPVLLLLDGHSTHVTMEASDICRQHGIEMYCLLEHSSHITQPLDLRLFGNLKQSWRQAVREYQAANVGEFVTKRNFSRVFKEAWVKSATLEAAIKGFFHSGIFPFNPDRASSSTKLEPSKVFIPSDVPSSTSASVAQPAHATNSTASVTTNVESAGNEPSAAEQPVPSDKPENTPTDRAPSPTPENAPPQESMPNEKGDAFSKYLVYPVVKEKKLVTSRALVPKAITGSKYRVWLNEKNDRKAAELKQKQERIKERMEKKLKKEEELKLKKLAKEKKLLERANARAARQKKKEEKKRILQEIEHSDSDDSMAVDTNKCFQCERVYDEKNYIQCTKCLRRFHIECVANELMDGLDELPFECKYC